MDQVGTMVVGAGVVGLAVARELAMSGREVVVIEKENRFGAGTSARNSEVIHAGIYYTPGSEKATLCVQGRHLLYEYCAEHGVGHRACGKLIVAADDAQRAKLDDIVRRAEASGVHDLCWLSGEEARALEPELRCRHALLSPSTGIIDSHGLMLALLGDAEDHGAMLALTSEVHGVTRVGGGFAVDVFADGTLTRFQCRELVNAAGLGAPRLARSLDALPPVQRPQGAMAKGNYFALSGRSPFKHLVYPVPNEAGLGVHLTLDLGGQARFGPDVEWVEREEYSVDPKRCEGFLDEIRTYWPAAPEGALVPAYCGIRPKLVGPGEPAADFLIGGPASHGIHGFVNLLGIESPGLTASLAIGQRVRALLEDTQVG